MLGFSNWNDRGNQTHIKDEGMEIEVEKVRRGEETEGELSDA
jgi:hypothetical protein